MIESNLYYLNWRIKSKCSNIKSILKKLSKRAKDGTSYGFVFLSHADRNLGHIINYFVDQNENVYFIDAQRSTPETRVSMDINLTGMRAEIFFCPSLPPEGYVTTSELSTRNSQIHIKKEKNNLDMRIEEYNKALEINPRDAFALRNRDKVILRKQQIYPGVTSNDNNDVRALKEITERQQQEIAELKEELGKIKYSIKATVDARIAEMFKQFSNHLQPAAVASTSMQVDNGKLLAQKRKQTDGATTRNTIEDKVVGTGSKKRVLPASVCDK